MTTELSAWIKRRYDILLESFKDSSFRLDDAITVLSEKAHDRAKEVPVFLSELRKAGLLQTERDPDDARKKIYRLKPRDSLIQQVQSVEELTRADIEGILKKAADLIRTRVDYKFILVLLFLKQISDKWQAEYEDEYKRLLEDGFSEKDAQIEAMSPTYHDFDLPEEARWDAIRRDVRTLPETFSKALKVVAERNPDLRDVVESFDYLQFVRSPESSDILRQLIELFSEKKLSNVSPDILGDAYEWILRYFAPTKAKEGEIYTPREVIKLLVELLDPKPEESVYDPACGSAGMLIYSYKHVEANPELGKAKANTLFLYGQEVGMTTIALAKMNLYLHGIRNGNLAFGDTLRSPKFKEGETFKKFDVVIANPPWNQDGYDEEELKRAEYWRDRFSFGFVPAQSADWAWVQHMIASATEDTGRVGVVIDNGCLFRGGKEQAIRSAIIEKWDLLECVILLPEKMFYNTGAPGAILVFRWKKPVEMKNKILFINASGEFEQHPEVRKLNRLGDSHIQRIVERYQRFGEVDGFARVVPVEEIRRNDFNLNVTLYVTPSIEGESVDLYKEYRELQALEMERRKLCEEVDVIIGKVLKAMGGGVG